MFELTKVKYKGILVIDKLTIPKGNITCILGESGAGKSTLLKLLNKIISIDTGEITYNGISLNEIDAIQLRRQVMMLPQLPSIYPGSIKDNLLIGLQFQEKPTVQDNLLKEILEFVRLNKSLEEDASKLSGGEKQRLALGRILLLEPDVFLLDEPSSALDEKTAELIIEKLVSYTKSHQKTLIMVTHSKQIAEKFSDFVVEVEKGRVKVNG